MVWFLPLPPFLLAAARVIIRERIDSLICLSFSRALSLSLSLCVKPTLSSLSSAKAPMATNEGREGDDEILMFADQTRRDAESQSFEKKKKKKERLGMKGYLLACLLGFCEATRNWSTQLLT